MYRYVKKINVSGWVWVLVWVRECDGERVSAYGYMWVRGSVWVRGSCGSLRQGVRAWVHVSASECEYEWVSEWVSLSASVWVRVNVSVSVSVSEGVRECLWVYLSECECKCVSAFECMWVRVSMSVWVRVSESVRAHVSVSEWVSEWVSACKCMWLCVRAWVRECVGVHVSVSVNVSNAVHAKEGVHVECECVSESAECDCMWVEWSSGVRVNACEWVRASVRERVRVYLITRSHTQSHTHNKNITHQQRPKKRNTIVGAHENCACIRNSI